MEKSFWAKKKLLHRTSNEVIKMKGVFTIGICETHKRSNLTDK